MSNISWVDCIAPVWFFLGYIGYTLYADQASRHDGNLVEVMNEYRRHWMHQMLKRDNRMVDAALIGNLLRSISFFASTTIFLIIGLFSLLKYREEASSLLNTIPYAVQVSPALWEAKIFLLVVIFVYTFFKFTWSLRQYNYTCVVIGAAPPVSERNSPGFSEYADNAARLIGNAAKHFNMALRGYYFGIAALAWFINGYAFILATSWVLLVLYRREFRSHALKFLMNPYTFEDKTHSK